MNDLEFRVWDTYRWAADDYGVMPKSAAKLRGENDALRDQHTEPEIAAALQRLVEVELIMEFDHQGATFVCSPTWQTHQKIEHPRQTHFPAPTPQVLASMDVSTRKFFRNYHENFRRSSASRARVARETANGKRLTANGSGDLLTRFEMFWAEYPRKTAKDAARKEWLHRSPDVALTNLMVAKVREHKASPQWRKDDGQFIPHARTWLHQKRWEDEASQPSTRQPWVCPHVDRCANVDQCRQASLLHRPVKAVV